MAKFPIIILHGWGLRGSTYHKLAELLGKKGYRVYAPDLPGFGDEPLGKSSMDLDDYVGFVSSYLKKRKVRKAGFIGHSFGGRVAIKFAVKFPDRVDLLILTGAPGIKHKLSFFRRVVMYVAVVFGELFGIRVLLPLKRVVRKGLYFLIGEWDYYNAGELRQTFKHIVSEALQGYLPLITTPTLLLWGESDRVIPVSNARKMKDLIPNAKLVTIKGVGHKLPYEHSSLFLSAIGDLL